MEFLQKIVMKIKNFSVFLLIFLLILAACSKQISVLIDNGKERISVKVEIADNNEERAKGLMFRSFLEQGSGMLFVFDDEDYHSFWMKNTLIPLDALFISKSFEIVDIKHMEPCKQDPCISYRAIKPAKYVLEVSGNFTIKNKIRPGEKVEIR